MTSSINTPITLINYNIYNGNINVNDAVKVSLHTPNLIIESFWVEIVDILNDGDYLCTIQNHLAQHHGVDYLDQIIIKKINIKEYKPFNQRFNVSQNLINETRLKLNEFRYRFHREPTLEEFMTFSNIQFI